MKHETIAIIDFGGQINQLVARRVRELNVYCEVFPATTSISEIEKLNPIGIICTGKTDSPSPFDLELTQLGIPVLAIGFGARLLARTLDFHMGEFVEVDGIQTLTLEESKLFTGLESTINAWTNRYQPIELLADWRATAKNETGDILALEYPNKDLYLLQFSPELSDTVGGKEIIKNFLYNICQATGDWTMKDYAAHSIENVRKQVGDGKVLLALSGGVDSSVVASLLEKAVGDQLYCIFVDHGLMRKNEAQEVADAFKDSGMHFVSVDAEERFLTRLKGVTDPETKRKIIGEEFIRVFEEEAKKIGTVDFFAQGTIYPDVIESDLGDGSVIKSHHNVGGLPDHVDFKEIIEPLRLLFKDEVRELGRELGLAEYLVSRQPFPGPGLGIRVIGEISKDKLDILRDADYIFREEIAKAGLDKEIGQYFVVITDMRSVGVTGETRTYDYTMALRAVVTTDFMTAYPARIPYDVLDIIVGRITSEVDHVNRIVYDITGKPPATIEWE